MITVTVSVTLREPIRLLVNNLFIKKIRFKRSIRSLIGTYIQVLYT